MDNNDSDGYDTDTPQYNPSLKPREIIELRDKYTRRQERLRIIREKGKLEAKKLDKTTQKLYCWNIWIPHSHTYHLFSSLKKAKKWAGKLTGAGVDNVEVYRTRTGAAEWPELIDSPYNLSDLKYYIAEAAKKKRSK